jgi:hypothetical protein
VLNIADLTEAELRQLLETLAGSARVRALRWRLWELPPRREERNSVRNLKIRQLRSEGMTLSQLAQQNGLTRQGIWKICQPAAPVDKGESVG